MPRRMSSGIVCSHPLPSLSPSTNRTELDKWVQAGQSRTIGARLVESVRQWIDAGEIDNLYVTDRRRTAHRRDDDKGQHEGHSPRCGPFHSKTPKLSAMANTPSGSQRTIGGVRRLGPEVTNRQIRNTRPQRRPTPSAWLTTRRWLGTAPSEAAAIGPQRGERRSPRPSPTAASGIAVK